MSRPLTLMIGPRRPAGLGRYALNPETRPNEIVVSGTREKRGVTLFERANARVHNMKVRTEDK